MKLERSLVINGIVVAAALGSVAAIVLTRGATTTEEQSARSNNLCAEFPRDTLKSLTIQNGDRKFTVERKQTIDAGVPEFVLKGEGPADAEAVESLLRALEAGNTGVSRLDGEWSLRFQPRCA